MTEEKIIAGLDIGTTKICCVVGQLNQYGSLEVLGVGTAPSEGVIRGMVTNIEKTAEGIKAAVAQACRRASPSADEQLELRSVRVSVAGSFVRSIPQRGSIVRASQDNEILVEDVERLCQDTFRTLVPNQNTILHVIPQFYTVDGQSQIKDPVGMTGVRLEADFQIVYVHSTALDSIRRAVTRAGLEVEEIVLSPLASAISTLTEEEMEAGVALIDIGGGTTDITIFYEGILRHTAVLPLGGQAVTQDIKQGCNVLQQQAELLKTKFGVALAELADPNTVVTISGIKGRPPREVSVRFLANVIEARMQEIIAEAHKEIIESTLEDKLTCGIVITGGGSLLHGVDSLVEFMTGQQCRRGFPNEFLAKPRYEEVKSPINSTGVGLVLGGFKKLDRREADYADRKARRANPATPAAKEERKTPGINIFSKFANRAKGFLVDDIEDQKSGY